MDFIPNPTAAVDPTGRVVAEVPCRRCGYILRTLHISGVCPECGTAVGVSVRSNLLRFSEPTWTRGLARGVTLMVVAINLAIVSFVVMILLLATMMAASNAARLTIAMIGMGRQ